MSTKIQSQIRDVLLTDWDPSGVAVNPAAHGAYDADIAPLESLIQSHAGEEAIVNYLFDREREIMCFPGLGKQRLFRVAKRLIAIDCG